MLFPIGSIMIVVLTVAVIVIGSKVRANGRKIDELNKTMKEQ